MVDNQHRQIPGYRDLDQDTVDVIREIKQAEVAAAEMWRKVHANIPIAADRRQLAIARTHLEAGFSALVRSVAKPDSPFDS
jgi:hypothetical protein